MNPIYWLVLFIALLVFEIITLGLTTVWFAGGALAALIAAQLNASNLVQWIIFCVASVLLLLLTRPFAVKYLNKNKEKTNIDSLIGQVGIVTQDIYNLKGEGEVTLNGLPWSARTVEGDKILTKDTCVEVVEVQGVKLIVKEKMEEKTC